MTRKPTLSTTRAAEIWRDTLWCRRELYSDQSFFKMTEVWETLCTDIKPWRLKTYRSNQLEDFKRKAGLTVLGDYVTLTVDERLWKNAERGSKLCNFILSHEFGHLALDHHSSCAGTLNFQLFSGPTGMSNSPPTIEELEANFAAVFFQCGVALMDSRMDPIELAHRAFSDVTYVKKAQRIVQLDVFKEAVLRLKSARRRVVL